MKIFRDRVLAGELLSGTWCSLGSSVTAEIAGASGFDWVLLDIEHGSGTLGALIHQLQGVGCTDAQPIVRIAANEAPRFKRVLDMGARGVMVPYVGTAGEATRAVESMRYPPHGIRGVAKLHRATRYGAKFEEYVSRADEELLLIVQIETAQAVENAEEIAAVDGVDVLFIGPLDLTTNLGIRGRLDHELFDSAMTRVAAAATDAGKASGILLLDPDDVRRAVERGYTFVAVGSDTGMVVSGMAQTARLFAELKEKR